MMTLSVAAFAQKQQGSEGNSWKEKLQAEKIALLTSEMELTPEEAQVFWPVYNKLDAEKTEVMSASRKAYKALSMAVKDGKDDAEIGKLLEEYLAATAASAEYDAKCVSEYEKVLPARKVAKLVLAEERFRKMQFQRLQGQGGPGPRGGDRPEGGRGPQPREN